MRFERRDFDDWFHSRRLPERLPILLILGLVAGAGFLALLLVGPLQHEPATGSPVAPPGGIVEATPMPVPLPIFEGEMTVIEPVQTAEPRITEAMLREYEKSIYLEVNRRRVENGLVPLIWDDRIAAVARAHSEDMARRSYVSHFDPEGRGPYERFGTTNVAENIRGSWGNTIKDVDSWMASPGHHKNIMDPGVRRTGVGMALGVEWPIITQNFLP